MDNDEFQKQTIKAINDQAPLNLQLLNRLLACEALLQSMLQLLDHAALTTLGEEYDAHLDRMASQFPPNFQRPQFWSDYSDAIAARKKWLLDVQAKKPGER